MDLGGVEKIDVNALRRRRHRHRQRPDRHRRDRDRPEPGRSCRRHRRRRRRPIPSSSTAPTRGRLDPGRRHGRRDPASTASPALLPYCHVDPGRRAGRRPPVNGNGGDDTIDATALQTPVTFAADGGAGNDTLIGSPGNDLVDRRRRATTRASLGAGDDTFVWNPGDGSDAVDGQGGPTRWSSTARTSRRGSTLRPSRRQRPAHPRRRHRRDGPRGIEDDRRQRPRRRRHDHRQRPVRDRRHCVNVNLGGPRAAATARPTPSSSTAPKATTTSRSCPRNGTSITVA